MKNRHLCAALAAVTIGTSITACGSNLSNRTSAPAATNAPLEASASTIVDLRSGDKPAVIDAYLAYLDARSDIFEHPDPESPKLYATTTGHELSVRHLIAATMRAKGAHATYDYWQSEIQDVTIDGDTAQLIDCHHEALTVRVGAEVATSDTRVGNPARLVVVFAHDADAWKVSDFIPSGECE